MVASGANVYSIYSGLDEESQSLPLFEHNVRLWFLSVLQTTHYHVCFHSVKKVEWKLGCGGAVYIVSTIAEKELVFFSLRSQMFAVIQYLTNLGHDTSPLTISPL